MMTRECSGSFTAGSRGRTNPFSTTPATANVLDGADGPPAAMTAHWAAVWAVSAAVPWRSARREPDDLGSAGQLQGWAWELTSVGGDYKNRGVSQLAEDVRDLVVLPVVPPDDSIRST